MYCRNCLQFSIMINIFCFSMIKFFFEFFIFRNKKIIEYHCFVFAFNCVKMSKKSWSNAFVFNLNYFSKLKCLNIKTSMKRFFNKLKTFWIFIANAKNFVNLFLTFFFNMKIKKITNDFSIKICKINKNLNFDQFIVILIRTKFILISYLFIKNFKNLIVFTKNWHFLKLAYNLFIRNLFNTNRTCFVCSFFDLKNINISFK